MANPDEVIACLRDRRPYLWANPSRKPVTQCEAALPLTRQDLAEAAGRWRRVAPLLAQLFPELETSGGIIESPLLDVERFRRRLADRDGVNIAGRLLLKADHALGVAGSIKARGGIYAVLHFAEKIALGEGILSGVDDDYRRLASPRARGLFQRYLLSVGSTGNLGLSIGIAGSALGFRVAVHMSVEAKQWKKQRLRDRGVEVVEHESDYTAACVVAREQASRDPFNHFIDDENSVELFMGYAVAAMRLKDQLEAMGRVIDQQHPLFLYLPCGVGGGPGGITFGARLTFADHAHCFFAEPVEAPCFALGMCTGKHSDISVYDIGLDLKTEADGLAVSRPSRFVGQLMEPLLSGCYTLEDATMGRHLVDLFDTEQLEVEPSATAGCEGPNFILSTPQGQEYLARHALAGSMANATHVIWTTGGSFVPPHMHEEFRRRFADAQRHRTA